MKLHLGCGEVYLPGYLNIDYPPESHTVQVQTIANEYHDILSLRYPAESIEEIRLHHVFEHFQRAEALALLAAWRSWLIPGGILRIEVPDFDRTAKAVIGILTRHKKRFVALRHIFGSQEAGWAKHCEGWSRNRLCDAFRLFGYTVFHTSRNNWRGTYNIEVIGRKNHHNISREDFILIAQEWLSQYMVDSTESERRMLEVWVQQFVGQMDKCWARDE